MSAARREQNIEAPLVPEASAVLALGPTSITGGILPDWAPWAVVLGAALFATAVTVAGGFFSVFLMLVFAALLACAGIYIWSRAVEGPRQNTPDQHAHEMTSICTRCVDIGRGVGVEPGRRLRELEQAVLSHDDDVLALSPRRPTSTATSGGSRRRR